METKHYGKPFNEYKKPKAPAKPTARKVIPKKPSKSTPKKNTTKKPIAGKSTGKKEVKFPYGTKTGLAAKVGNKIKARQKAQANRIKKMFK